MEYDNPTLSDYEKIRAKNVVRNNAVLRSMGLISASEEKQSNAFAWRLSVPSDKENSSPSEEKAQQSTKKTKKRKAENLPKTESVRKSSRLQGLEPDGTQCLSGDRTDSQQEEKQKQRQALVEECRQARQRAALRVMEAGAEKAAKENPTATYEHCLMRVKTMTEKGLMNRIKAIERAAGKHCVVKMAIFKSCLQDEDRWDLAHLASEALERLKALQPAPEE
jgi:hypothetical protein